ncbi:MAG: glycerophosphodiester phosphodiesterase family protein, partial [Anaerolineae bacterium]
MAILGAVLATGMAFALSRGAGVAATDLEIHSARGYAAAAPENTLASLKLSRAAGVATSWVDIRTTADGVLVLLADETLDRTTDCTGPVASATAATVAACDAGSWFHPSYAAEGVPTLAEALAVPGGAYVLDLRDAEPAAVVDAIVAAGAEDRVAVSAADATTVAAVEAAAPQMMTWLHVVLLDVRAVAAATTAGADGIAAPARNMSGGPVAAARRAGLAVAALAPGGEGRLYDMVAMGVDVVVTPRLKAAQWALGATYRTYGGPEFSRANEPGSDFPAALAVGDFNNDGRADLALGAPADTSGGRDAGWLGVTFGGDQFPNQVFSDAG